MSQSNVLALELQQAHISRVDSALLEESFAPLFQQAEEWKQKAEAITVTSALDIDGMKRAREARIALKDIRNTADKRRKELKDESLRRGKAIDGVANVIKFLIIPLEEHLEKQEKFVEFAEKERKQKLRIEREKVLSDLGEQTAFYNLADMEEDKWQELVDLSTTRAKEKKEAAQRLENERIEKENADAKERIRIREENERLKIETQKRDEALAIERKKREEIEAKIRIEKEAEEKIQKQEEEERRQEQIAPEKEKLVKLADAISSIPMPEVASKEAKAIIVKTIDMLTKTSQFIRKSAQSL